MGNFVPWNSQDLDTWAGKYGRGKFIELDGHKTHYVEQGSGDPVILIHGFNYDLETWMTNMDALAANNKVYALDLWGFGFSTREPLDYGYDLYVDQLRLFMDYLDIPQASLIGHSMGGGIAISFSVNYPQRVARTVLLDAVGIPRKIPLRGRLFMLPIVPELLLGLKTNAVRQMNLRDFWIHNPELITEEYFAKVSRFQQIKGTTESMLTILRKDFFNTLDNEIQALAELNIPTLIIWGRWDQSVPLDSGHKMHQILKGSRLEILEEAGHLANFDQSDQFNALVLDFLENN